MGIFIRLQISYQSIFRIQMKSHRIDIFNLFESMIFQRKCGLFYLIPNVALGAIYHVKPTQGSTTLGTQPI